MVWWKWCFLEVLDSWLINLSCWTHYAWGTQHIYQQHLSNIVEIQVKKERTNPRAGQVLCHGELHTLLTFVAVHFLLPSRDYDLAVSPVHTHVCSRRGLYFCLCRRALGKILDCNFDKKGEKGRQEDLGLLVLILEYGTTSTLHWRGPSLAVYLVFRLYKCNQYSEPGFSFVWSVHWVEAPPLMLIAIIL